MPFDPALTAPTGVQTLEMPYEWDETKRRSNIRKHAVEAFDMETAIQTPDLRYAEPRVRAYGYIGNRMHTLVRKANRREEMPYAAS